MQGFIFCCKGKINIPSKLIYNEYFSKITKMNVVEELSYSMQFNNFIIK